MRNRLIPFPTETLEVLVEPERTAATTSSRKEIRPRGSQYRDRAAGDVRKVMTLSADEFLRRFLSHVLPRGFQRIRHYGLLASRNKKENLTRCRELLGVTAPPPVVKKTTTEWLLLLLGIDITCCPRCGNKPLVCSPLLPERQPLPPAAGKQPPEVKDSS